MISPNPPLPSLPVYLPSLPLPTFAWRGHTALSTYSSIFYYDVMFVFIHLYLECQEIWCGTCWGGYVGLGEGAVIFWMFA